MEPQQYPQAQQIGQPQQIPPLATKQVLVTWDAQEGMPHATPDTLTVQISKNLPVPIVIVWHAAPSIKTIDKIEFNYKGSDPVGEFSAPVGGGGGKAWVSIDKGTKEGAFYYSITATPAGGGSPKTNDPMVLNQDSGG